MVEPRFALGDDFRIALDRVAFVHKLGIDPDPWQHDLLRSDSDRVLLNCSRQSGKSTMTGAIALHRALYHPGSLILCLAPALRQSQELFGKILGFYRDLDRPVRAQGERKLSLELENGSRIVTLPGTERTVRGFSGAALLLVDEASRVDDGLYYAVRPMLAVSGGALMMLSTPAGRRGVFSRSGPKGGAGNTTRCRPPRFRASPSRFWKRSVGRCRTESFGRKTGAPSRIRTTKSSLTRTLPRRSLRRSRRYLEVVTKRWPRNALPTTWGSISARHKITLRSR
jgi:hypothetical protein